MPATPRQRRPRQISAILRANFDAVLAMSRARKIPTRRLNTVKVLIEI
jgi:protein-tyrosine-phosphatase